MKTVETTRLRRLELLLQQAEALPTLPAVAFRLSKLLEEGNKPAAVELVHHDPSLTARVLSACRGVDGGRGKPAATIKEAVHRLGPEGVLRVAVEARVLPVFAGDEPEGGRGSGFSYTDMWRRALGVGVAAELIATAHRETPGTDPGRAFTAGLLHDIGKLALAQLMPKSYQRVFEEAEGRRLDLGAVEREVIGLDHQTVGKRLAERWGLPHALQDCIWLHGSPWESLPELPHRHLIAIVGLAALVVPGDRISGAATADEPGGLVHTARQAGLDPALVIRIAGEVLPEVERRIERLGLSAAPTRDAFLDALLAAHGSIGRGRPVAFEPHGPCDERSRAFSVMNVFYSRASRPALGVHEALDEVAASAAQLLGAGYFGLLHQPSPTDPWLLSQYSATEDLPQRQYLDPPGEIGRLSEWGLHETDWGGLIRRLPELGERVASQDRSTIRAVPLPCGWGVAGVLLHDRRVLFAPIHLQAAASAWGFALAAVVQHHGAKRLGEQLVEAHRTLADARQRLLQSQSLARVGQVAAGAAHEMNNPLAIISGRAQLLRTRLPDGTEERHYAEQIWRQAERVSDMISALRLFAEPPRPDFAASRLADVVDNAWALCRRRHPDVAALNTRGVERALIITTDPDHLAQALAEVLTNAHEAHPKGPIVLSATVDPVNNRLIFRVADDGVGMDAETLEHAFDPFFSSKPAGRQAGLGLARARRLVEGLGGDILLTSTTNRGTTATLRLPLGKSMP